MKGDRERCLAAGMDAYVSKPIRAAELFEIIARFAPFGCRRSERDAGPGGATGSGV